MSTRLLFGFVMVACVGALGACHPPGDPPGPNPDPDDPPGPAVTRDGRLCDAGDCDVPRGPDDLTYADLDPQACAQVQEEAEALIQSTMTCQGDNACDAVLAAEILPDACIPIFQCYLPRSAAMDEAAFREQAEVLDRRYRLACGACPDALCIDESVMLSTCETGVCELDVSVAGMPTPQALAAPQ